MLIASEKEVKELGLTVLAEIRACSTKAVDPHLVGISLGRLVGCTGACLIVTLHHELARRA